MKALKRLMGCKHSSHSLDIDVSSTSNNAPMMEAKQSTKSNIAMKLNKSMFVLGFILGEGGFGKVSGGICIKNKKWYAIKEVHKSTLLQHKTGVPMILNELRSMGRVDHPNIINLHFAFQDQRKCYFVMDLQIGGDLRYYLRKRYLFEEVDVAFYVACMSSALDHLHSRGIIHRDIKPENILLDERGYPYLTDFGVAHLHNDWDNILASNLASGTKQYLAPEVFTKTHLHGPEVDFWSLGVVAYELLWGKRPFDKHVSVNMITYLEKALIGKRRQVKEAKMRQMMSLSAYNSSSNNNTMTGPDLNDTPVSAYQLPHSTSAINALNSTSSNHLSLHQIRLSGMEQSPTKQVSDRPRTRGGRPSVRSSILSTSSSTASERNTHYCSSVNYTQLGQNSNVNSHSHYQMPSNQSAYHSREMNKLPRFGSFDSEDGGAPTLKQTGPLSPDRTSKNTSSTVNNSPIQGYNSPTRDNLKLPSVIGGNGSPIPKPLFAGSNKGPGFEQQGMIQLAIANAYNNNNIHEVATNSHGQAFGCASGSQSQRPSLLVEEFEETNNKNKQVTSRSDEDDTRADMEEEETSFHGFIPGDHWLVDDCAAQMLPEHLRVDIPTVNPWLGELTPPCVDLLQGLFDIRPSHRYGAKNMHMLEEHDWFAMYDISFDSILNKTYKPHFKPGGKFLKKAAAIMEDMSRQHYDIHENYRNDQESQTEDESEIEILPEQHALFEDFRYIAMQYHHLFPHDPTLHKSLN